MIVASQHEIMDALGQLGQAPDDRLDLAQVALLLGAINHPGLSLDRYRTHITTLGHEVGQRHADLLHAGTDDTAETRLAALKHVLADRHGYQGDEETYDDLQNADLVRVIDRRKGLPIALGILYLAAGRALDWEIFGLNLPGHFALRLDKESQRLIFDPFHKCKILHAPDLREIIKRTLGPQAELASAYFEPVPNREILLRLENNIKLRQIENEEYREALGTVETMRAFAPDEYRLLLDAGVLYARTGQKDKAIDVLEDYIARAPNARDRQDAALFLREVLATPE